MKATSENRWVDNHLEIDPPAKTLKVTGTRFASILGLNPWSTPFAMWCEVTKLYREPFVDSIYTLAGKAIEPIQIDYVRGLYPLSIVVTPTDRYGQDYFKRTWGDFFPHEPVFGGMWDALLIDEDGAIEAVFEMKTTKRAEDWKDDIPEYYALQGALYAHLLGCDTVIMVASFLDESDYDHPEEYVCTDDNTACIEFSVSERYPDFELKLDKALRWFDSCVRTGISPDYNEQADKKILAALNRTIISADEGIAAVVEEAEKLISEIESVDKEISVKKKRLTALQAVIKENIASSMPDDKKTGVLDCGAYVWTLSRALTHEVDTEALKRDGLYEKYVTDGKIVERLTKTKKEK